MTPIRGLLVVAGVLIVAGLDMAAETNILSFSYNTSLAADASTPDTWGRKLNDGCWTNVASDGVRYTGDVAVTLDLARRTQISRVDVYTFPSGGASPLSTQGVTLEGSHDAAAWIALGALSAVRNGLFSGHAFFMNARYLRVTCAKGSGAVGQSLAEIVVAGASASASGLLSFTYATSMPYNAAHTDPSMVKLCDGSWTNAGTQSVQYGPGTLAAVNTSDPAYCIASNVVVVTTLSGVRTLRGASLLAFRSTGSGGYATSRVTLSNSLDGVTWSCAGVQTNVENSFPGYYAPNSVRFDFTLPNVDARYLAFACEKTSATNIVWQLLGEIQISETPAAVFLGDPLAFTYEFSKAPSVHVDRTDSPKLTDGAWNSNTRNAVRIYGDFSITADLGTPRYVAGTDLLCWSNNFSQESGTYSTGRVVVNGSLDKTNWTQVADITRWSPSWPYHHAGIFSNSMPFARYLRFDAYRCTDTDSTTNTAQIMGELTIYRPPSAVVGARPVEATNAIQNAGFEDAQIPDGDSATMLVKGGVTNGWTFSYASSANYAGFQRNNSPVSTNYPTSGYYSRYFASEGK